MKPPLRDFISLGDLSPTQWKALLKASREVKDRPGQARETLLGRSTVLLFEKPSLRTRLTFELGMKQLGGDAVYLDYQEDRMGQRESLQDVAKNLERWFDCLVARTFSHQMVKDLAAHAEIPVINALTDEEHPCQALADIFTLMEKWAQLEGKKIAYVGDGNNVCTSLVQAAALSGMSFLAVTPPHYQPDRRVEEDFARLKTAPKTTYSWTDSLDDLAGADAVYTDTWVSMGKESETNQRMKVFLPYQVTPDVMEKTGRQSFFMHCLPAHRNHEVSDAVMDASFSLIYEQAENRLHVQKALILAVLAPERLSQLTGLPGSVPARESV